MFQQRIPAVDEKPDKTLMFLRKHGSSMTTQASNTVKIYRYPYFVLLRFSYIIAFIIQYAFDSCCSVFEYISATIQYQRVLCMCSGKNFFHCLYLVAAFESGQHKGTCPLMKAIYAPQMVSHTVLLLLIKGFGNIQK